MSANERETLRSLLKRKSAEQGYGLTLGKSCGKKEGKEKKTNNIHYVGRQLGMLGMKPFSFLH